MYSLYTAQLIIRQMVCDKTLVSPHVCVKKSLDWLKEYQQAIKFESKIQGQIVN